MTKAIAVAVFIVAIILVCTTVVLPVYKAGKERTAARMSAIDQALGIKK